MVLSPIGLKTSVTTKYSGKRSPSFLTIEIATFWKIFPFYRTNSKYFYWHENICLNRKDVLEQKINQVLESVGYPSRGFVFTVRTSFYFFYINKNISTTVQLVEIQGWSWAIVVTTLIIVVDIAFTIIIFEMTLTLIIAIWSNWLQKSKWVDHCGSDLHSHQYQIDCVVVNIISSSGR